jgi:hypothetical protein
MIFEIMPFKKIVRVYIYDACVYAMRVYCTG